MFMESKLIILQLLLLLQFYTIVTRYQCTESTLSSNGEQRVRYGLWRLRMPTLS